MGRRGDPAKDLQQLVAKVVNGLLNVAERLDDFRYGLLTNVCSTSSSCGVLRLASR